MPGKIFADEGLEAARKQLKGIDFSLGRDDPYGQNGVFMVLGDIINRLPFYLTGLAFFAFLYSAGMYIFAFGDETKQTAAKKNMTWTAIGMLAVALVSVIIMIAFRFTNILSSVSTGSTGRITDINQIIK